jgi:hypothetical protein
MIRLEQSDLDDAEMCAKLAAAAHLTPTEFLSVLALLSPPPRDGLHNCVNLRLRWRLTNCLTWVGEMFCCRLQESSGGEASRVFVMIIGRSDGMSHLGLLGGLTLGLTRSR